MKELLHQIKSKLGGSTDEWSAPNSMPFKCITVHYVDDAWELQSSVLAFEPLQGSHTGEYLLDVFKEVFTGED